jgi:hypothetical protein
MTQCKHEHNCYGTDGETLNMTYCLECGEVLDVETNDEDYIEYLLENERLAEGVVPRLLNKN